MCTRVSLKTQPTRLEAALELKSIKDRIKNIVLGKEFFSHFFQRRYMQNKHAAESRQCWLSVHSLANEFERRENCQEGKKV
jgi:hypothetical protein